MFHSTLIFKIAILLLFLFISPFLWADQEPDIDIEQWAIYAEALELLVEENTDEALRLFKEFLETYPQSSLRRKVEEYINILENKLDHSGIVSFYITQMLSTTYVAFTIPQLFEIDLAEDSMVYGLAGIAGVGLGLGSAWLMTKDNNLSLGQDLWIENIMVFSLANYNFLCAAVVEEFDYEDRLFLSGQLALTTGSRIGGYFLVKDSLPSPGRASFFLWSYLWAQYYTWLTTAGVFKSEDARLNSALGLIIPDLFSIGSYFLWDTLHWSFDRNGLISISGLGGILVGSCINLILTSFEQPVDQSILMGVMIGSALAGTGLGIYFTDDMKEDKVASALLNKNAPENNLVFVFTPSPGNNGLGLMCIYSY